MAMCKWTWHGLWPSQISMLMTSWLIFIHVVLGGWTTCLILYCPWECHGISLTKRNHHGAMSCSHPPPARDGFSLCFKNTNAQVPFNFVLIWRKTILWSDFCRRPLSLEWWRNFFLPFGVAHCKHPPSLVVWATPQTKCALKNDSQAHCERHSSYG